jgi:hypothetical protein
MALVSASKRSLPRRNAASSAPSLIARPNSSSSSRLSRRELTWWTKRRYIASATMVWLNGVPGSNPSGSGAKVVAPQQRQCPA